MPHCRHDAPGLTAGGDGERPWLEELAGTMALAAAATRGICGTRGGGPAGGHGGCDTNTMPSAGVPDSIATGVPAGPWVGPLRSTLADFPRGAERGLAVWRSAICEPGSMEAAGGWVAALLHLGVWPHEGSSVGTLAPSGAMPATAVSSGAETADSTVGTSEPENASSVGDPAKAAELHAGHRPQIPSRTAGTQPSTLGPSRVLGSTGSAVPPGPTAGKAAVRPLPSGAGLVPAPRPPLPAVWRRARAC